MPNEQKQAGVTTRASIIDNSTPLANLTLGNKKTEVKTIKRPKTNKK